MEGALWSERSGLESELFVLFLYVLEMVSVLLGMQAQLLSDEVALISKLFCFECCAFIKIIIKLYINLITFYPSSASFHICQKSYKLAIHPFIRNDFQYLLVSFLKQEQMGQSNTNPFREGGQLMSEYTVDAKIPEQSLTFLTHKTTRKEYLLRQQTFNDLREFSQNSDRLKKRSTIKNPHLTNLIRIEERTEDHLCSNFYKIYSLWEHPNKSLADQITARALQKKSFEGQQLWSMMAGAITGLAALQQQEVKHECLTPKAILLCEEGNMRVVDPLAHALQTNIDCVYNNRSIKHIYLSPQQCESVETQKPIINKNPYKNDVFVLGMIILQCGLLQRQDQCYLNECSELSFDRIEANLRRFGDIYENELRQMVGLMLRRDIRERPDWLELAKHVSKQDRNGKSNRISQAPKREHFITRVNAGEADSKRAQSSHQSSKLIAEPPKGMFYKQQQPMAAPTTYVSQTNAYILQEKFKTVPPPIAINSNQPQAQPNYYKSPEFYRPNEQVTTGQTSNPFTVAFNSPQKFQTPAYLPQIQPNPAVFPDKFVPNSNFAGTFSKDAWSSIPFVSDKQSISSNITTVLEPRTYLQDLNANNYVRPAQSVNYQITRQLPLIQRAGVTSGNYSIDPKFTRTPQLVDHSDFQAQPTFVEQHFKMGSRYQGYKLNGQRHGHGKFFYQDGGSYDGQWRQNKMEGQGTLYYQSNRVAYEGAWVADKFQGVGKLYNQYPQPLEGAFDFTEFDAIDEYWAYYQGNFTEDLKDGHGILKFSNGQVFEGTFKQDMVEGEGIFVCRDGRKVHGIWHQNYLQRQFDS